MKSLKISRRPLRAAALILLIMGLMGCYTVLQHPSVANREAPDSTGTIVVPQTNQNSCTSCHNNDYDHSWGISRYNWGFDYWGRSYPNYTPWGYNGWQHYYYDPWWGGYGYNSPYPYYQPGPGAPVGPPPPPRDNMRRGQTYTPPGPQPPMNPPLYNPPPPAPTQGQGQGQQQGSENKDDRKGRRGGK
ncbi:MAG: hypothetical protein NTW14_08260 [bacterium]|nr:hypothetical protein [bacterium]